MIEKQPGCTNCAFLCGLEAANEEHQRQVDDIAQRQLDRAGRVFDRAAEAINAQTEADEAVAAALRDSFYDTPEAAAIFQRRIDAGSGDRDAINHDEDIEKLRFDLDQRQRIIDARLEVVKYDFLQENFPLESGQEDTLDESRIIKYQTAIERVDRVAAEVQIGCNGVKRVVFGLVPVKDCGSPWKNFWSDKERKGWVLRYRNSY